MNDIFTNISDAFSASIISNTTIIAVLVSVLVFAIYEFLVYRFVSHRSFYNKSFNITIAILPFFIATIILCLQSNVVITLGTIGALAIIRFRTAVKDPVDMIYLLWSVHTGIICGCQLYPVALFTSLIVTVVLVTLEHVSFGKKPFILVAHTEKDEEEKIREILDRHSKSYRIKSRNVTNKGCDYAIELSIKKPSELSSALRNTSEIERFSIIEYDADDIV
jgi:uncharacterized membrane protein YhiD involved in acid resistance